MTFIVCETSIRNNVTGPVYLSALPCTYVDEYIYASPALVFPNAASKTGSRTEAAGLGRERGTKGCAWDLVVWSLLDG